MTPNNWRGEGREREHGEGDESETRARRGARMMRRGVGRAEGARSGARRVVQGEEEGKKNARTVMVRASVYGRKGRLPGTYSPKR